MSFVFAKLPKAGLGNKLLVWAKAYAYAKTNNRELVVIGWLHFSFSNLKLWNKNKRFYSGYFIQENNFKYLLYYIFISVFNKKRICYEFENINNVNCKIQVFSKVPHWSDYFKGIRENHKLISDAFFKMLKPEILNEYKKIESPAIAIHIRMGDFRKLKEGEDFRKVGGVRTPLSYFINLINNLRVKTVFDLPVTIFSDGTEYELSEILNMPNVKKANNKKDILDMLQMSKADIIISSAGSTFSFWSAYFSRAIVFIHPDHFHSYIRPEFINSKIFEGPTPLDWNNCPVLLEKNLQSLKIKYSKNIA